MLLWWALSGCAPEESDGCPNDAHPGVDYASKDPAFCATAFYVCDLDEQPFPIAYFECGCGCLSDEVAEQLTSP